MFIFVRIKTNMTSLLLKRLMQLSKKLINGSINNQELEEYKSLLELANAIVKVRKYKAEYLRS